MDKDQEHYIYKINTLKLIYVIFTVLLRPFGRFFLFRLIDDGLCC